jgi:hypothetical protein
LSPPLAAERYRARQIVATAAALPLDDWSKHAAGTAADRLEERLRGGG